MRFFHFSPEEWGKISRPDIKHPILPEEIAQLEPTFEWPLMEALIALDIPILEGHELIAAVKLREQDGAVTIIHKETDTVVIRFDLLTTATSEQIALNCFSWRKVSALKTTKIPDLVSDIEPFIRVSFEELEKDIGVYIARVPKMERALYLRTLYRDALQSMKARA